MAALEPLPFLDGDDDPHYARERPGRKRMLTADVHEAIMAALSRGAYVKEACLYANVRINTYYDWLRRGREYDEHLDDGGDIIEGEDLYRQFWLDAGRHRGAMRVRCVGVIAEIATSTSLDPGVRLRAATTYLERTAPEDWGRVNRTELSGPGGTAITVQVGEVEKRLSRDVAERRERVERQAAEAEESEAIEEAEVVPEPTRHEVRLDDVF